MTNQILVSVIRENERFESRRRSHWESIGYDEHAASKLAANELNTLVERQAYERKRIAYWMSLGFDEVTALRCAMNEMQ